MSMSTRACLLTAVLATALSAPPATAAIPTEDLPRDGCSLSDDPVADTKVTVDPRVDNTIDSVLPEDPDLDITRVALRTYPDKLVAYVHLKDLATTPNGLGRSVRVGFYTPGGPFLLATANAYADGTLQSNLDALADTDAGRAAKLEGGSGSYHNSSSATAPVPPGRPAVAWDAASDWVTIGIPRSTFEALTGAPLVDGTKVDVDTSTATWAVPGRVLVIFDRITAKVSYTVGDNRCFGPPPGTLTAVSPLRAQYGDRLTLAARLTASGGAPAQGRAVRFTYGTAAVTATTDSAGVARGTLTLPATAGSYVAQAHFAGDTTVGEATPASVPFTITTERTVLTTSATTSGSRRTVTATLKEDDGRALAGQTVTFKVGSAVKATVRTDAKGTARWTGATPRTTVTVTYAGVSGKWLATTTTRRVP